MLARCVPSLVNVFTDIFCSLLELERYECVAKARDPSERGSFLSEYRVDSRG